MGFYGKEINRNLFESIKSVKNMVYDNGLILYLQHFFIHISFTKKTKKEGIFPKCWI